MNEKKDSTDRTLDGRERENERINIKRLKNQKEKLELEKQMHNNQIAALNIEVEIKNKNIAEIDKRIEQGKKLINGAKISEVFQEEKEKQ